MAEPTDNAAELEQRLSEAFLSGAERHADLIFNRYSEECLTTEARRKLGDGYFYGGFVGQAAALMAEQTLRRQYSDLEELSNRLWHVRDYDDNVHALLLALFISGRGIAGGATIEYKGVVYGDARFGLDHLTIEPGVKISDFDVDVLLAYSQEGPNPAHEHDPSQPVGMTVIKRVALVRDNEGRGVYHEQRLRRLALAQALAIPVVSYNDADVQRDPFALATRVIRDLAQGADDELSG